MRVPDEAVLRPRTRRRGIYLIAAVVGVLLLLAIVQATATFYTNFLWFHYSGVGTVWRSVTETKAILTAVFIVAAFVLVYVSLFVVDRVSPRAMFMAPESEFVRHYQAFIGLRARWLRLIVAAALALILGSSTSSQWQHWLLFEHTVSFNRTDRQFHRDLSFYVFRLPFLSFLVDWLVAAFVVTLVVTAVFYFLNGAIRLQSSPRIEPRALAHLSLILALLALVRAWAYYYVDRYTLDLSSNGVVQGAGYTDVHVRLPAMTLLAIVSLAAFVMLVVNIYRRNPAVPFIAFGLWAFLALVLGVIVPALVQLLHVTPDQSTLELPYVSRNIAATQQAMGIANVTERTFPTNQDLTAGVVDSYASTVGNVELWDPQFSSATFQKVQDSKSYYNLTDLAADRYEIDGKLTPVVVGVRALNSSGIANQSWVNTHLQYTHGYGAVAAVGNTATSSGEPSFALGNLPPTSTASALHLTQSAVYFAPGQNQYVVANTKQLEADYPTGQNGETVVESHYKGKGGIPFGSLLTELAFAVQLREPNLVLSSLITNKSRLIYIPNVRSEVEKSLPFLRVDSNPYSVVANGQIDWIVDAYATTDYYPYGESADTSALSASSGLSGSYNYVRDAVKVVVNAYSGKMQFYAVDPSDDPIIESYMAAFPHLIQPLSAMNPVLLQHLRYPQDLLTVQAAMYGRYHIPASHPSSFYGLSDAWDLSQTSTSSSGSPSSPLATAANGSVARYTPIYELLQLPGQRSLTFNALEPLVPYSTSDRLQTLSALLIASSSAANYGQLEALVTPRGKEIDGPGLANAAINSNRLAAEQITLLDTHGSTVALGTALVLPVADSLMYIRPLYVSASQTALPTLDLVVIVYGKQVFFASTLQGALADAFGAVVPTSGSNSNSTIPAAVRGLISQAVKDYGSAHAALAAGNLGTYESDLNAAGQILNEVSALLNQSAGGSNSKPAAHPASQPSSTTAYRTQLSNA